MTQSTAEDIRKMLQTITEYQFAIQEEDAPDDNEGQPIDTMLVTPSKKIDADKLAGQLKIDPSNHNEFVSTINALQDQNSNLTADQKAILANALQKMSAGSQQLNVSESTDDVTEEPASIDDVLKSIKTASESSPVSKLQATTLANLLLAGIKNRSYHGGMDKVFKGIQTALQQAQDGNESDALHEIASIVNHVEGDKEAFDQDVFPKIVVSLLLLVGDLSQHTEK
jgi:hypothetical protein